MKYALLPIFTLLFLFTNAQEIIHVSSLASDEDYENIKVEKIHSDSLSTTFIIWIKKEVKAHKHLYHSETIYVVEGKGIMKIAGVEFEIKENDLFNIPKNTIHSLIVNSEVPMKVISFQSPEFLGKDRVYVD